MTARGALPILRRHPCRRSAMRQLDRTELMAEVRRLAALEVEEHDIIAATGLGPIDVRRILGERP